MPKCQLLAKPKIVAVTEKNKNIFTKLFFIYHREISYFGFFLASLVTFCFITEKSLIFLVFQKSTRGFHEVCLVKIQGAIEI